MKCDHIYYIADLGAIGTMRQTLGKQMNATMFDIENYCSATSLQGNHHSQFIMIENMGGGLFSYENPVY